MFINDFVTKRINAKMRELTLRQAIDLCEIPDEFNELGISRALEAVITETTLPLSEWTIQERIAALIHYITAQERGDWQVADGVNVSDYLIDSDYPLSNYLFDDFEIIPLTAKYVEAIERACNSLKKGRRGDWVVSAMAISIRKCGQVWDDEVIDELIAVNSKKLLDLPESEFSNLVEHFFAAQVHLAHGVAITFSDNGIAVLPQKGGSDLPSVRFQFNAIISETTRELWRAVDDVSADDFIEA